MADVNRPRDAAFAARAASHFGIALRTDALEVGLTRGQLVRRTRAGVHERVHPRVIGIAGVPPSWERAVYAACLWIGPPTVASYRTAAAVHGFAGFGPGPVEVTTARGRSVRRPGVVVHTSRSFDDVDRTVVRRLPVTTVARTIIDLSARSPDRAVERMIDSVLRTGSLTLQVLRSRTEALSIQGRPCGRLRRILDRYSPASAAAESELERLFLSLVRRYGLPMPVQQHVIHSRDGAHLGRVDHAYVPERIFIEIDGYTDHSTVPRFNRDRDRQNEIVALGWRPIRYTYAALTGRPRESMQVLADALGVALA